MKRPSLFGRFAPALFIGLLVTTGVQAQRRLSLNDALELGLKNRYDLQADAVSLALTENSIQKNRNNWLPEVNVSGDVRYNTQLQTTVIPAGAFPGGTGNGEQRLAFGTRNSTIFALNLTQPLYRPEAKTDLAIVQNNGALEQEKNNQRKTNVKIKIAKAYLNVLLKEIQRGIAQADRQRYQQYFDLSAGKYKLGALLEADHLTAQLNWQNSQLTAQKAEQSYRLAQTNLCYEVNIPADTSLVLTDRIDAGQAEAYQTTTGADSVADRTEIRQLTLQLTDYRLREQKVLNALKPTLSLYGNYSTQFLSNSFNYFSDSWFPFNYFGLQLKVPLSGQFTKKTNLQTYQLQARQIELNLHQTRADLTNELRTAETELTNASRNLQSTRASLDVSRQISQLQQEQYRLGAVLYSNVLDTEGSLQTAEQNYIEAAYHYLVAKLNYEKALGKY
ncbi:TolC family protein [Larkinella sp. GY13]|uniref:TolC family protein n=1 Tax=Larkinella sp. GY13 TaxID=3453720 RepID=UPI003EE8DFE3